MTRDPLDRLVACATGLPLGLPREGALPGPDADASAADASGIDASGAEAPPFAPRGADRRQAPVLARHALPVGDLRVRVRELIAELARRIDEALPTTLSQAHGAWDQIDALRLLDKAVHDEHRALDRAARRLAADDSPELRALGTEVQLTLDAVIGLVSLVERRLATLVRLRLRAADPSESSDDDSALLQAPSTLLPDGRPFLDLGAALHETARRWT